MSGYKLHEGLQMSADIIKVAKTLQRHAKELWDSNIVSVNGMVYIKFTERFVEFLTIPGAYEKYWLHENVSVTHSIVEPENLILSFSKENANFFGNFLNTLIKTSSKDKIIIQKKEGNFLFSSGSKTLELSGLDCDSFPIIKKPAKKPEVFTSVDISQWSLIKLFAAKIRFKQNINSLNGIYINEKRVAIATNSEYILYIKMSENIKTPLFFPAEVIKIFPSTLRKDIQIINAGNFTSIKHDNLELILNSNDNITQNNSFPIDLIKQIIGEKKVNIALITGKELKAVVDCMIHKNNKLSFSEQKGTQLTSWEDNARFHVPFDFVAQEDITIILSEVASQTFISLTETIDENDQVYVEIQKTKNFLSIKTDKAGFIIADVKIE